MTWKRCNSVVLEVPQQWGGPLRKKHATRRPARNKKDIPTQLEEKRNLGGSIYSYVTDFIAVLEKAAEGLEEARVNVEYDFGDEVTVSYVQGWRDMTAAEIELWKAQKAEYDSKRVEWQAEQDARALAELRKRYPDQFK